MAPSMKKEEVAKRKEVLVILYIRQPHHEVRRRLGLENWREAATRTCVKERLVVVEGKPTPLQTCNKWRPTFCFLSPDMSYLLLSASLTAI